MSFKFARVAAIVGVAGAVASPFAFGQSVVHEASPHSGGLQMARKVQAQRAAEAATAARTESGGVGVDLSCSPKPCLLPNVQASAGPQPVNENAIAANPATGTDLVSTGNDYNCPSLQGIFTSNDSGTTWRRACMTSLPGNSGLGDPVPAYDTKGRAHLVGINSADGGFTGVIVTQRSVDQGLTWRAARQAVPNTLGGIADKPWLEADTNTASPFKDSLYISVTNFASTSDSQITVSRSRDGGNTWATTAAGTRQTFPDVHQFSDLAVGRDGTVYLTYMKCRATNSIGGCGGTTATMLFQKSTDGGVTWSPAVAMTTARLAPFNCGAFYGCLPNTSERVSNIPSIAVDGTTGANSGKLYVTYYDFTGGAMKVRVVSSSDGGTTWGAPKAVAPASAAGDQFFPWVSVSGTGEIAVTWLDRRNDAANVNYEAFGASSTNGGNSFPLNVNFSSVPSNPFNDGFGSGFMGDYTGNVWVGKTLFMSYMDTRTGVSQNWVTGGSR
jgi:BNR repeat-like domain